MGHKVGWLTLYAGIAGGADVILIPEIPYDINSVINTIKKRTESGKKFSILAVAEGAISKELAAMPKKKRKAAMAEIAYPSISYKIAKEIQDATGQETRVTVPDISREAEVLTHTTVCSPPVSVLQLPNLS